MILNEAVTLLGYKVDERELERYKKQLRQQEAEALKLLNQREARAKLAEREKLAAAQRAANEQARIAARAANAQIREAQRSQRAQERALAAQTRAHERAQAKMARDTARRIDQEKKAALAHLRGSGAGVGGLGMLGSALSVGGLAAGAKSVYDTGTSRESMLTGLKNLPGMNEQSALREFKRLQEFNTKTPFGLDEITSSYIRLRNMGLNASNEAMTAYGGIAASIPGKKINDFVEAVADGVMGEAERLKEFGIKMKVEGDKAAITFRGQTLRVNRDAKSIERALIDIGTKNFANTMGDLAKTTGGQMSNLKDQIEDLKWQIWQGGMRQAMGQLIQGTSNLLKQWSPLVREFSIFARLNMPTILRGTAEALKLASVAMGLLIAKTVGQGYLNMVKNIGLLSGSFKTLGASAFFAESGLLALAKGGALISLVALLGDFVYYMNTGDSALVRFTGRWPALSKAIKDGYYWNRVFIEAVSIGYQKIAIKVNDIYQKTKLWFDHIKREIGNPLVLKFLNALAGSNPIVGGAINLLGGSTVPDGGGGMSSAISAAGGGSGGSVSQMSGRQFTVNGQTFIKNQRMADQLTDIGATVYSGYKQCLRGVWLTQQAVTKNTSMIHSDMAYKAADELSRDKRFKEIKITYDMYQRLMAGDAQMKALFDGANVIYDQQSGFSPTAGHAEIWDTNKKKAYYGSGAASMVRSKQMIDHSRVFIPVEQSMPVPANRSNQVSSLPPIMIEQNFNGQVSPIQVKGASSGGVQVALHRASLSASQGMS